MSASLRRRWDAIGVPLGLLIAFELVMVLVAWSQDARPFDASTWAHWDATYYQQIASRGYYLTPCNGQDGLLGTTCGDTAWFPGLGWLTSLVTVLGGPQSAVMLVLVRLFAFGTLLVVWNGLLDRRRDASALAAMVLVAFAPGAVYFHALFPVSMATCLVCGTLALARRERWWWAALCGGAAATTYTTAGLVAPALVLWVLLGGSGAVALRERIRRCLLLGGGPVLGVAVVWLVMTLQTGEADAFQTVQGKYDYPVAFPTAALWDRLDGFGEASGLGPINATQSALVVVLLLVCVAWAVLRRPRGIELLAVLTGAVFWVVPFTLGQASLQRSEALVLPLAVVVARLPRGLAWSFAAVAVAVAGPMASFYVRNLLV